MAKAIDNEIKSLTTSWEGFKGSRVEEFIKYQLSKLGSEKFGYLNIESGEGILVKSKDKSQKHLFLNIIIMEVNTTNA